LYDDYLSDLSGEVISIVFLLTYY